MMSIVRMAGYVSNAKGEEAVGECVDRLRQGRSVLLFPEGTRSPQSGLGPFKRGAAHVALRSEAEVVPVLIRPEPSVLSRERRWYDYPASGADFYVEVGAPMTLHGTFELSAPPSLRARRLTAHWAECYASWWAAGARD